MTNTLVTNAENVKVALELDERAARTVAAALQSYSDSFNTSDPAGRLRRADSELILGALHDAIKDEIRN